MIENKNQLNMIIYSVALLLISLWQLEVLFAYSWDAQFDLPFHIAKVDKWWVRDMFYCFIALSWYMLYHLIWTDEKMSEVESQILDIISKREGDITLRELREKFGIEILVKMMEEEKIVWMPVEGTLLVRLRKSEVDEK